MKATIIERSDKELNKKQTNRQGWKSAKNRIKVNIKKRKKKDRNSKERTQAKVVESKDETKGISTGKTIKKKEN